MRRTFFGEEALRNACGNNTKSRSRRNRVITVGFIA
jgi:hypothetical protein